MRRQYAAIAALLIPWDLRTVVDDHLSYKASHHNVLYEFNIMNVKHMSLPISQ